MLTKKKKKHLKYFITLPLSLFSFSCTLLKAIEKITFLTTKSTIRTLFTTEKLIYVCEYKLSLVYRLSIYFR